MRNLTCIICPVGCNLQVELDEKGKVQAVTGNTCPRGAQYAKDECTNPVRTVTSTIRATCGALIPVKTDKPIPKDKIFACMEQINRAKCILPIAVGDVIIKDVFGSNIVATKNVKSDGE